jgi:hypothetical protein
MPDYPTRRDLTDEEWAIVAPLIPPPRPGGGKRRTDMRAVVNGLMYILSTGCQWRYLPGPNPSGECSAGWIARCRKRLNGIHRSRAACLQYVIIRGNHIFIGAHSHAPGLPLARPSRGLDGVAPTFPWKPVAVYFTKRRYDARASTSFGDNLLEIPGIGGSAAA